MSDPLIGFVGLGQMGGPMALHLLRQGHRVIACDRAAERLVRLAEAGAETSLDTADLAAADLLFLSLPHGAAVAGLLLGAGGLAPLLKPGSLVVDTSTIDRATTLAVAAALAERGVGFLDAPVSGMGSRAEEGSLTVMVGGREADFRRALPFLEAFGREILYMGAQGAGQLTKLVNQLLYDINLAALAEILPMAAKLGLDPERIGQVVNNGTGRSQASAVFIPRILEGRFEGTYPLNAAYKDLVAAAEIGAREGIPLPVLAAATATYQQALLRGYGEQDKGAMIRVFEELLGVAFRKAGA